MVHLQKHGIVFLFIIAFLFKILKQTQTFDMQQLLLLIK